MSLISLTSVLDIILVAVQILITTMNFKCSPWYDPENLFGMLILLFNPVAWIIVITLLLMNFAIKEMKINGKMLLVSIGTYTILLISLDSTLRYFQRTPYFLTIFNTNLVVVIVIYAALAITILINTIRGLAKVNKEKCNST